MRRYALAMLVLVGMLVPVACGEPTPTSVPPTKVKVLEKGTEVYLVNKAAGTVTIWQMGEGCQWEFGTSTRRDSGVLGVITDFCYTEREMDFYYEIEVPGEGVIGWVRVQDLLMPEDYTP